MNYITIEQLEELRDAESNSTREFNELLEEYTGITAKPYTAFYYEDSAGNWVGDSSNDEVNDLLQRAYIEVRREQQQ